MVKEELTSEEKFFEKAVVTEKFVKKYKNVLIASVAIIVLAVAGNIVYTINKQNTLDKANSLLAQLQAKPNNPQIETKLKELSPALSSVWKYSQAVANNDVTTLKSLKKSDALMISDLASYEVAQNSKDVSTLQEYADKQNAIYSDLARVESAVLLMNEKKIDKAHEVLSMINVNSPLAQVAKSLMHYGVK